jgi:hypothetical protein
MKRVIYRNRTSRIHQRKAIFINEFTQDQHVKTAVRKGFFYHVVPVTEPDPCDEVPEIYIQKHIDTKKQIEEFCFRVKGSFITMAGTSVVRVQFSHKLRIHMKWKEKTLSPKKSGTLT